MKIKNITYSLVIALFLITFCYAEGIPTYKGFPIYPPQRAEEYASKDLKVIKITLFDKESLAHVKFNDFSSASQTIAPFTERIDKAEEYIKSKAAELGWKIKSVDVFRDGGSRIYSFIKDAGDVQKVDVIFWSPSIVLDMNTHELYFQENFGIVEYYFQTKDRE